MARFNRHQYRLKGLEPVKPANPSRYQRNYRASRPCLASIRVDILAMGLDNLIFHNYSRQGLHRKGGDAAERDF